MAARLILSALLITSVLFYIRFLVALCEDGKRRDGKPIWLCRLLSVPSGDSAGYDLMSESATRAGAPRRVLPFEPARQLRLGKKESPLQARKATGPR